MKRVPKAPPKENQTNQQRNASEAERKLRVQFTKQVEELNGTRLNGTSKTKSNQAVLSQSAERSSNQQLKGTTRNSKIYWKKSTLKQRLATK